MATKRRDAARQQPAQPANGSGRNESPRSQNSHSNHPKYCTAEKNAPWNPLVTLLEHHRQVVAGRPVVVRAPLLEQRSRPRRISWRGAFAVLPEELLRQHVARVGKSPAAGSVENLHCPLDVLHSTRRQHKRKRARGERKVSRTTFAHKKGAEEDTGSVPRTGRPRGLLRLRSLKPVRRFRTLLFRWVATRSVREGRQQRTHPLEALSAVQVHEAQVQARRLVILPASRI